MASVILPVMQDKFENKFEILRKICEGSMGIMYICEEMSTGTNFAIKKICHTDPTGFEPEVDKMIKVKSKFTVPFITAWADKDFVFIQMKFCPGNLKSVIEEQIPVAFPRGANNKMSLFEYFVCIELFRELAEDLNYLHNLDPIIMHRDLKPLNVLYTDGQDQNFLVICDFGISKEFQKSSNSSKVTWGKYVAWEVDVSRKYNYKSDIFSLFMIALDIFRWDLASKEDQFNGDQYLSSCSGTVFESKAKSLISTIEFCIDKKNQDNYNQRPTTKEILTKISKEWAINPDVVKNDGEFANNYETLRQSNCEFLIKFTEAKLANKKYCNIS